MYVKLKKKYSQNFLIDNNIKDKIIDLVFKDNLIILEIGPGNGSLTDRILKKNPSKFDLIEIDNDLVYNLKKIYKKNNSIKIINEDILKFNLKKKYDLVISNLPYNISSQVLIKLALLKKTPKEMILMFQKEFAYKLLENNLNAINSIITCFYNIKLAFNVSKNCFRPIPKVDSSVVKFEKLSKNLINENEIENFIKFKKYLFSHKRKSLKKLLKKYEIGDEFDLSLRAESLKIKELINIFRKINF